MNWKSFWNGFCSIFNIWGTPPPKGMSIDELMAEDVGDGFKKDRKALASDWEAVGRDFKGIFSEINTNKKDKNE